MSNSYSAGKWLLWKQGRRAPNFYVFGKDSGKLRHESLHAHVHVCEHECVHTHTHSQTHGLMLNGLGVPQNNNYLAKAVVQD